MNKIIIASFISIAVLTACSTQASPAPTVTITEQKEIPAPPVSPSEDDGGVVSNEQEYLISIRAMNNPILAVGSDEELLSMGYSVCELLGSGLTIDDIIQLMATQMTQEGMTSDAEFEAVGYIIGAAGYALCPGTGSY